MGITNFRNEFIVSIIVLSARIIFPKEFLINRKAYAIAVGSLLLISLLHFAQNYFKYGHHVDYIAAKSFFYNLLVIGLFALCIPIIHFISNRISSFGIKASFFLAHLVSASFFLIIYALAVSVLLYGLGFLSIPFSTLFLTKYFLGISLLHFLVYVFLVYVNTKKNLDLNAKESRVMFISASHGNKNVLSKISDIIWIEAMDHYVKIHTEDRFYLKKTSLTSLVNKLGTDQFVRIHRSYIINRSAIQKIIKTNGSVEVLLNNNYRLQVGKTYQKKGHGLTFTFI